MRTRAAKGRRLFSLAALCVLVVAILAPAPATASRTLPRATSPGLERLPALEVVDADDHAEPLPLYTFVDVVALDRVAGLDDDQVEATIGRQRYRLHLVSSELARPGALVWGSKTATGVSTWLDADKHLEGSDLRPKLHRPSFQGLWTDPVSGLSYARNRWYDARSASWLSEDPMGAVDSPNLYAPFKLAAHVFTDPLGLHSFRKVVVDGAEYSVLAPDPEELSRGELAMSVTYQVPGRDEPTTLEISQHEGEMIAFQAKLGNPLLKPAFELFYGASARDVDVSVLTLWARGVWHHKSDIAISTLAGLTIAGGRPGTTSRSLGAPRVNLLRPRPSTPPPPRLGGVRPHPTDPNIPGGPENYRGRFQAGLDAEGKPRLPDSWDAHHVDPQRLAAQEHPLVDAVDIHNPLRLRGVPGYGQPGTLTVTDATGRVRVTNVHAEIDREIAEFLRRNPTPKEWAEFRRYLDWRWGHSYWEAGGR